jgi:hypothetical protein
MKTYWTKNPAIIKELEEMKAICMNNLAVVEKRMNNFDETENEQTKGPKFYPLVDNYLDLINERKKIVIQIRAINSQL